MLCVKRKDISIFILENKHKSDNEIYDILINGYGKHTSSFKGYIYESLIELLIICKLTPAPSRKFNVV